MVRSAATFLKNVKLLSGNIVDENVDALICPVTPDMQTQNPVSRAIFDAAGFDCVDYIMKNIEKPRAGESYVVPGHGLVARHILLTLTPHWRDGIQNEDRALLTAYRTALAAGIEQGFASIALPAMISGSPHYPPERAARLVMGVLAERLPLPAYAGLTDIRIVSHTADHAGFIETRLGKSGWIKQA